MWLARICLVVSLSWASSSLVSANEISFNRDIRPLLSNRCFACHGPDAESREAGLRLDQADGDEGALEYAIEPGSIEDSEMWNRITSDDEFEVMPPPDSHLEPLDEAELNLIKRWIESGAKYESFWAFEPPIRSTLPIVDDAAWSRQPIDLHVLKKLESINQVPADEAEPRTLIRRVTFDLTGLPPTRSEIAQFLNEHQRSPDDAWERLVDRLLDRPQYGEHMGRYWLDLVRFADSNGMHKDFYRNQFAYRDWVIRSFNNNVGYDDFLRDQLAGDLHAKPSQDQLIASGFNRLHLIIDRGTALPEESFSKNVTDRVTAVGTAFLGLTVQCAQCHDHKFDPITQKDFFALTAFFNNIDAKPETVSQDGPKNGFQPPFISLGTPEQDQQRRKLKRKIALLKDQIAGETKAKNQQLERTNESTSEDKVEERKKEIESAFAEKMKLLRLKKTGLQKEFDQLDATIPKAMVMKERRDVRPTFVLERGQYDSPGDEVQRGTPAFLPPLKSADETPSRMDLAEWFLAPKHPLTARVAVNRVWQQFFGVGLVKTSEDFGSQGDVPSHPELLDHLAVSFVESGWDIKALVKQIAMSKTYRQSSASTPDQFNADSDNRMLGRGSRYRLDAEVIRDQILATSGFLSNKMYGLSVKPPQPDGLWKAVSMIGETYEADSGEATRRRSVYTFWKRSMPPPQMTILNAPLRDSCVARRERTNTPTQALLLLNEAEYLKAARNLAVNVLQHPAEQRIDVIWETVTSQLPDERETSVVQKLLDDLIDTYSADSNLAEELCAGIEFSTEPLPTYSKADLAAWTVLGNVLFNLDITKTKD